MYRMRYGAILAIVLCSSGCLSPLPPAKIFQGNKDLSALAIIEGESDHAYTSFDGPDHVMIMEVDGKSLVDAWRDNLFLNMEAPEKVIVEPGKHYLTVRWRHHPWSADMKLWLDAEAGKTYVVHKIWGGKTVEFWITEGQSGRTVGGIDTR